MEYINSMNNHKMTTRSKSNKNSSPRVKMSQTPPNNDDVDEHGNLAGFIDYDCNEEFTLKGQIELQKELSRLSRGNVVTVEYLDENIEHSQNKENKKKNKKNKKKDKITTEIIDVPDIDEKDNSDVGNLLMGYILNRANAQLDADRQKLKRMKKLKKKLQSGEESDNDEDLDINELNDELNVDNNKTIEILINEDVSLSENSESDDDDYDPDEEASFEENSTSNSEISFNEESDTLTDEEELSGNDINSPDKESDSDLELDQYDEEFTDLVDMYALDNSEDGHIEYFHGLKKDKKKAYLKQMKELYKINDTSVPLKFKVLESKMDDTTKAKALANLDKLSEMDVSTGEYSKMDQWINGLIKIPFNTFIDLPVKPSDDCNIKKEFLSNTCSLLDKAVYGHKDAKSHILQVIGKWIRNTHSGGNVLAIQGPMGNGKTTLIKEGIAKSLDRPFAFIALGGASDSSFFDGHCYTYEGSRWGRIVDILHKCKCMNPIICFDELDKVSDTSKGDEIINMLIHMTDSSQNKEFHDNYFPGVDIDLSKVLFVFSFNDEIQINRILKDRMQVIRTKGYDVKDKIQIAQNYLLSEIYETYDYTKDDIVFTDESITYIIEKFTDSEEGVRNLKRCLENIVSIINIYNLTDNEDMIMESKIKDFKLPIQLNNEHIDVLLKKNNTDVPPPTMYL